MQEKCGSRAMGLWMRTWTRAEGPALVHVQTLIVPLWLCTSVNTALVSALSPTKLNLPSPQLASGHTDTQIHFTQGDTSNQGFLLNYPGIRSVWICSGLCCQWANLSDLVMVTVLQLKPLLRWPITSRWEDSFSNMDNREVREHLFRLYNGY